ncbi:C6 transcription factor domain-containing protein [Phanerochaete sordida]|uniref:C6 transcription factor domain-containing protein n=1 Tax=Phanerochaete sordida TaxID=48140 RepID=A0A9P3LBM9_9APHY|nr:C6 transcription factor domain-containing protein [Phanerochaete sordida]
MKTANALQRGKACLSCRKRKMRCDGQRPICGQCVKGNRDEECSYHDKKQVSRTEMLRAKVAKLEARLRELEVEHSGSSSSPTPAPMSPSSPTLSLSTARSSPSEELILLQPPAGSALPLHEPASIDMDSWDDDDRFVLGAGSSSDPSSSQDSSLTSTPWLSDFLDIPSFLNDPFFPTGDFSPALLSQEPRLESPAHWEDGDVMCQNKQKLLDIFFAHRHQCAFDVHVDRFRASMSLPPAQQPHPALLDAMYLMACYFSQMPPAQEGHYLQRALTGISSSLQDSDRLIQIVQASCLIAIYFFSRGRTLEGYYHSSTAARLAVSLGLHQIKSEEWYRLQFDPAAVQQPAFLAFKSSLQLPPPKDSVEHAERVAAFWQVFQVDRAWSVASGLPAALPDDDNSPRARVETTWPTAISDSQDILEYMQPTSFIANAKLNPGLRAKATTLFERSYRLAAKTMDNDDLFWRQQNSLDLELIQFGANMPQLSSSVYQDQLSRNDLELVSIHTLLHASTIHLHRDLLTVSPPSYHRCVGAAEAITGMIKELNEGDYAFLNPMISTCWRAAAHVYLAVLELQQQRAPVTQAFFATVNTELDALISAMRLLGGVFPLATHDAQRTQSERAVRLSSVLFVPS